jgi:UDP-N-acetylmuramoyl-tripeptide--D-alanyl-D-alanine ligase
MNSSELYQKFLQSTGITTDTRAIGQGQMFFALKGDKFNANCFAQEALEQGASFAVVDEAEHALNERCILVNNVLESLQKLANYHRKTFNIPVIGLTGSNGKTTNKELLSRVLATKYRVHATKGNLNNHIGVPLTLLSMPANTEMAVIEMGANHQKEIASLCEICEPNYGFITNLGKAHLEGFGGEEGVLKGKGELFDFLKKNQGSTFVNENNQAVMSLAKNKDLSKAIYFGKTQYALKLVSDNPAVVFETPSLSQTYTTHLGGTYNFENIQTAFAIGQYFGVSAAAAAEAIALYNPTNNRSQIIEKGTNTFLMDAYNANPSSMAAAISNFITLHTTKPKVVVLGDMFELGEYAQLEHEAIGQLVASGEFGQVILFGDNMKHALKFLPNAYYFTDKFSLHNWLIDKAFSNTFFLVKGSRGVGLESILTVF